MFDNPDLGPGNRIQRQGAAVFAASIAGKYDPSTSDGLARYRRELFFAVNHEVGHCFNLTHSFEKEYAWQPGSPSTSDGMAYSLMNYPGLVDQISGQPNKFWKNFEWRFDYLELVFLRHAPEEFVQMGGSAFGKDHGYETGLRVADQARLDQRVALAVRLPGERRLFDFLEPVVLDASITNSSALPLLINPAILDSIELAILRDDRQGADWRPYAVLCRSGEPKILLPGESLDLAIFASAGPEGWHIAEPGRYQIAARLPTGGGLVVRADASLRVAMPRSREEEVIAQDYFGDEVGRALGLGGTRVMEGAIATLTDVSERLRGSNAARHAALTLARPLMRRGRVLTLPEETATIASVGSAGAGFVVRSAEPDRARRFLDEALGGRDGAVQTFGRQTLEAHRRMVEAWAAEGSGEGQDALKTRRRGGAGEPDAPRRKGRRPAK